MTSDISHYNAIEWALSGRYDSDKPVLIDALATERPRFITKNNAAEIIASLVGAFERDTTVCLHLANDILYPLLVLAVIGSSCRWTGTNIAYTVPELKHHIETSDSKYVITSIEHIDTVRSAAGAAEVIIFTDILADAPSSPLGGFRSLHDLQTKATAEEMFTTIQHLDVNAIAMLSSTSGTTGRPKMAARTQRSLILESAAVEDGPRPYYVRRLYCTPIFHGLSAPEMIINALRLGNPSFFMRRYDDVLFPRKIEEFKITETFAPPPIMVRLVSNSREAHNQLRSLRNIYTGGAALLPELRTKFLGLFEASNRPTITQVWGMTECGWVTTFKYPEIDDTCSIGRLLPGCHIKVVDADYEQHGAQKAGEIYTHSPYGMSCYWRNEQATEMAFEDKERYWLRTGDIGFVVSGKFYIADRAKEIFKVNGFQVAPPELEDALIALPGIRDAAVIGSGSNHGHSEHPIAFLVRDNPFVTAGDVLKGLSSRITRYKTNTCEVRFVDQLPKSETGKVLKGLLREYIN